MTWDRCRRWAMLLALSGMVVPVRSEPPAGREDLSAKVEALLADLDARDPKVRDQAERDLAELDADALELLPETDDRQLSAEQRLRLMRVIPKLYEKRAQASVDESVVIIAAESAPLSVRIQQISDESGNRVIDLRSALNQPTTDPDIRLEPGRYPFWTVVHDVAKQSGLVLYPNQEGRAIGLAKGPMLVAPIMVSKAFCFRLDRVVLQRDLRAQGEPSVCQLDVVAMVEPRLRPIQVQVHADRCHATDDESRPLDYLGPDRVHLTFDEYSIELSLPLRFRAPERSAQSLKTVEGTIEVLIPSYTAEFAFPELTTAKESRVERPGVSAVLHEAREEEEGVWNIQVTVEQEPARLEEESYLQNSLVLEPYLMTANGDRVDQDGGMSTEDLGNGQVRYEYLFIDAPGKLSDYSFHLNVPSNIARVPVPFRFENVVLP